MSDTAYGTRVASGRRLGRLAGAGLLGTVAAMAATATGAALGRAAGVAFEVPDGGETIPVSGVAFVTGVCSLVGVGLALALLRWSARPAERFVRTAVALTAVSLVPPFAVGARLGTSLALVALHLLAAAIVIPTLARALVWCDDRPHPPPSDDARRRLLRRDRRRRRPGQGAGGG